MVIKMILKYKLIELVHFDRKCQILSYVFIIFYDLTLEITLSVVVGRNQSLKILLWWFF